MTKMKPIDSTASRVNCQINSSQPTYKSQANETVIDRAKHDLSKNLVGDCQFIENSNIECFGSSSSSADEKLGGNDVIRVSLEKMAAEQFRRTIYSDHSRTIQSEMSTSLKDKLFELTNAPPFSFVQSVSTSKLRRPYDSSRLRKRSQDRFPFTMPEKPSAASYKLSENLEGSNSLERTFKLQLHPSITRLAGAGFEDTPAEVIDYVSHGEERPSRSGMRGLVQRLSVRLKKSKKRNQGTDTNSKMANVLYENRGYQGDSAVDSCSESSLLKEIKTYRNFPEKPSNESLRRKWPRAAGKTAPSVESGGNQNTLCSVRSCSRHDSDSLCVQQEHVASGCSELQTEEKDPYSVFYAKVLRVAPEASADNISAEHIVKQDGPTVDTKVVDEGDLEGAKRRTNVENRRKNLQRGCLCLRLYRMMIPTARHRSRISHSSSVLSIRKKSRFTAR